MHPVFHLPSFSRMFQSQMLKITYYTNQSLFQAQKVHKLYNQKTFCYVRNVMIQVIGVALYSIYLLVIIYIQSHRVFAIKRYSVKININVSICHLQEIVQKQGQSNIEILSFQTNIFVPIATATKIFHRYIIIPMRLSILLSYGIIFVIIGSLGLQYLNIIKY